MLEIAHGIVGRSDLPIPEWLFGWAAAVVLVVSFVALAVLWPEPRLQDGGFRPLPGWMSRAIASRVVDVACGAIGVFLLGVVLWAGFKGSQTATANLAPTFVYVVFWLGLVPVSVLFGDVFRAFNPWRAVGRFVAWVARTAARGPLPAPLAYPERLGHWPAAAGIFAFATMELVSSQGDKPENVAIAALIYSAITFVAMALYGVEAWCARGEAYGVYFNLFSRISPWTRRGDTVGLRRPLSGLADLKPGAGTVGLLAVMIGSVTFDGAQEAPIWTGISPDIAHRFESLGLSPEHALEASFFIGLCLGVLLIWGFYRVGIAGARSIGGGFSMDELSNVFVHTLVPIALAYVSAHYLTLLLYQGQAAVDIGLLPPHVHLGYLASNPLGHEGTDLFGTANRGIDYGVIGATTAWYYQVTFVVLGHVAGLTLAHDRALAVYDKARLAVRSQYWMLAVMVGFTSLALWLLSQSNT
jgi:hypothetical protein